MTLILECNRPFLWRPGQFTSRVMRRFWWGPFALGWLRIPLTEYQCGHRYDWRLPDGTLYRQERGA